MAALVWDKTGERRIEVVRVHRITRMPLVYDARGQPQVYQSKPVPGYSDCPPSRGPDTNEDRGPFVQPP